MHGFFMHKGLEYLLDQSRRIEKWQLSKNALTTKPVQRVSQIVHSAEQKVVSHQE